jgi:HAD superfamily hydrolase (TIGR01490 family)
MSFDNAAFGFAFLTIPTVDRYNQPMGNRDASMSTGAFFDIDGTLYRAHMWRGLMSYAEAHGRRNHARLYYASLLPLFVLRKYNLMGEEAFRIQWVMRLGWVLRGWSAAEGQAAFRWIADEYIRPTARDDMLACLREHVAAKHPVFLVSAMLAPVAQRIGEPLGVTGVVGTEIELREGRLSGRVIPPACAGIEKDRLTRRFLEAHRLEIDFAASYAYADSISDLPLLEMVGHPVAVYPDAPLATLARERGWRVMPESGAGTGAAQRG